MQLYALDAQHRLIFAGQAQKQQNYSCIECQNRVRLRGGLHRQNHFYHLEPNLHCRLSGKGMIHLQTQMFIVEQLPYQECQLEYRFPLIKRIADVAWIPHQIIFEIQCSPISAQEVIKRNQDYNQLGWEVVWIFHDQCYNQWRFTAAEWALRHSCHYFTNIDQEGKGYIYDQFDEFCQGLRKSKGGRLPIQISQFKRISSLNPTTSLLKLVSNRLKFWALSFQGDLIDLNLKDPSLEYFSNEQEIEDVQGPVSKSIIRKFKLSKICYKFFVRPYWLLFQMLLEKVCR